MSGSAEEVATSKKHLRQMRKRLCTLAHAGCRSPRYADVFRGEKKAASVFERAGGTKMLNPIELSLRGSHVRQGVLDSVRGGYLLRTAFSVR